MALSDFPYGCFKMKTLGFVSWIPSFFIFMHFDIWFLKIDAFSSFSDLGVIRAPPLLHIHIFYANELVFLGVYLLSLHQLEPPGRRTQECLTTCFLADPSLYFMSLTFTLFHLEAIFPELQARAASSLLTPWFGISWFQLFRSSLNVSSHWFLCLDAPPYPNAYSIPYSFGCVFHTVSWTRIQARLSGGKLCSSLNSYTT